MVAVGFNPRTVNTPKDIASGHRAQHGRRRLRSQPSLRDESKSGGIADRELKPTATIVASLRDEENAECAANGMRNNRHALHHPQFTEVCVDSSDQGSAGISLRPLPFFRGSSKARSRHGGPDHAASSSTLLRR